MFMVIVNQIEKSPGNQKSNKNCITKKREKENPNQCKMKMRKTLYINYKKPKINTKQKNPKKPKIQ